MRGKGRHRQSTLLQVINTTDILCEHQRFDDCGFRFFPPILLSPGLKKLRLVTLFSLEKMGNQLHVDFMMFAYGVAILNFH